MNRFKIKTKLGHHINLGFVLVALILAFYGIASSIPALILWPSVVGIILCVFGLVSGRAVDGDYV